VDLASLENEKADNVQKNAQANDNAYDTEFGG
jgi:hypothetical protein